MRLFCFHHAGGGAAMFGPWKRLLRPGIDVVGVEIADRDRFATLGDLVDHAVIALAPQLHGPHAFFGHSFGALLAYRLAGARVRRGHPAPQVLVLSSYAPPHLPAAMPAVGHLDDEQLAAVLGDLGGLPPTLSEWPALRDRAVAAARGDLRLCTTDDASDTAAVPCPIHAIGGREDALVSDADLGEWRAYTTSGFSAQTLPGGHFYLDDTPRLISALRPILRASAG